MSPMGIVPNDIDGVIMKLDDLYQKFEKIEESHKEVKAVVDVIKTRLVYLISGVVIALGTKYGLDLTSVLHT